MPGEEAGGAVGSFGDILVSIAIFPSLTLGAVAGPTGGWVGDAAGVGAWSGEGADDSGSAPALTLGLWARDCCNSRRAA
jgi:hypothetical protein